MAALLHHHHHHQPCPKKPRLFDNVHQQPLIFNGVADEVAKLPMNGSMIYSVPHVLAQDHHHLIRDNPISRNQNTHFNFFNQHTHNSQYEKLQPNPCNNFLLHQESLSNNVLNHQYPSQHEQPSSCKSFLHQKETLRLVAASSYLPKDNEKHPRGDDAHFINSRGNTIGVADGVGAWIKEGVDAGEYARNLMTNCIVSINKHNYGLDQDQDQDQPRDVDPRKVLQEAFSMTRVKGSSTACIITLTSDNLLRAANVGDSGFMVIRDKKVVFKSAPQQRCFNHPYQLGSCSDDPSVAQEIEVTVRGGDILVAGTDGLFDNMHGSEIVEVLEQNKSDPLKEKARAITNLALYNSFDKYADTPFAVEARKAGKKHRGGKVDDITVVVAHIEPSQK